MKKANVVTSKKPKQNFSTASRRLSGLLAAFAPLIFAGATAYADDAPPPSNVHALVSFEFSNEYLTPRGMITRDQGLTVQPLLLGFISLYKGDGFINSFTLVPGVWNDLGTKPLPVTNTSAKPDTAWTEIDPIAGISVGFAKHFTLDVTYVAFVEQILSIGTVQNLDIKLSFDDSTYLKAFALHPYIECWQEIANKSTDADVAYAVNPLGKVSPGSGPGSSYYFEVGAAPSYTFDKIGLKLELPCRVLLPNKDFYGEYYSSASTVGLYEVGIKATVPMNFMPAGYGSWSFHAGFRYQGFVDKNLQNLQQFNATSKPETGSSQVYCGISVFF